jgi:hypothetical protein
MPQLSDIPMWRTWTGPYVGAGARNDLTASRRERMNIPSLWLANCCFASV